MLTSHFTKADQRQELFVNEANDPTLTEKLQSEIKDKLNEEFSDKSTVSLKCFAKKYSIGREIKGELFYQLLHMDFGLTQKEPHRFGDIDIHL